MGARTTAFVVTVAFGALLALAAHASARNLGILNAERGFRIEWRELTPIRFIGAGGRAVSCALTLEGSFEVVTFAKRASTRIGRVTRAALGRCTGGSATVLTETLPWNVTYQSFSGTLPAIASVTMDILGLSVRAAIERLECLMRTEAAQPARTSAEFEGGGIAWFRMDEFIGIALTGGFFCSLAGSGHLEGRGNPSVLGGGSSKPVILLI